MLLKETPLENVFPVQAKWGESVTSGETGFLVVPDMLVKNQLKLGLDVTDMTVLLNIILHWWKVDELPYPRPSSIANRMGVSTRTVERRIKKMEGLGLIKRLPSESRQMNDGSSLTVRRFDLKGLIDRLEDYALAFQAIH